MNYKYLNYLNMLLSVKKFLGENSAVTSVKPAFARAITRLNEKIAAIQALDEKRGERGSGVTGTKSQVKEYLIDNILKTAGAIKAYASENNKPDLIKEGSIKKSDLIKIRELDLVKRADSVYERALSKSADLNDFGVEAADLNSMMDLRNTFSDLISEVGSKQGQRAGKTKSLDTLFEEVKIILEQQVDGLAETFKKDNPSFYNQYKAVRVISDRGGRRGNGGNGSTPPQQ